MFLLVSVILFMGVGGCCVQRGGVFGGVMCPGGCVWGWCVQGDVSGGVCPEGCP